MSRPNDEKWNRKLAGYLHDPPGKSLDIAGHWEVARAAFIQAGFDEEAIKHYEKSADHTAAAADRLPFPRHDASGMRCHFDGQRNAFRHPLSGERLTFKPFSSAELCIEGHHSVQPVVSSLDDDFSVDWQARYFAHWRLWRKHASENDYRLGYLPADTRIPDHTIWHHMALVSALAGCVESYGDGKKSLRPAFLKLHLGPVQDFIAAARSVRDLWSGSYLISWLMAAGLKSLTEQAGPDAVLYPSLYGQPLFDLRWRDDLWSKISVSDEGKARSVWESLGYDRRNGAENGHRYSLLVPSLPNVFLAVVPASDAEELAKQVESAIRHEWSTISEACWNFCDAAVLPDQNNLTGDEPALTHRERKARFERQVAQFLQIAWAVEPWPANLESALALASDNLPAEMPVRRAARSVSVVQRMATQSMPKDHRDHRYYADKEEKTRLNNTGVAWAVLVQHVNWMLDAVRQTRHFDAWAPAGAFHVGTQCNKDTLGGREEAVAGGRVWFDRCQKLGAPWSTLFKSDDWVGATTLVKRVWHLAWLKEHWRLRTGHGFEFPMPNTHGVAAGRPFDDDERDASVIPDSDKYFAVLALDGDEMGRWVGGELTPRFAEVLADYTDGSGNRDQGAAPYFRKKEFGDFLNCQRPLTPGFHLQFSETLSNFSLFAAARIVEHFQGRLIYAGGDDVLALLPARNAIACALALRAAFRGVACGVPGISSPSDGFLQFENYADKSGHQIPLPMPGTHADCSVGLAMAHFKSPLQDVVRAAQTAEKRAKQSREKGGLGRSALAVSLFKRSGEITEWGAKWDDGGLPLFQEIFDRLSDKRLTSKFPHRVCELMAPYIGRQGTQAKAENKLSPDEAQTIAAKEFLFALTRQSAKESLKNNEERLMPLLDQYLQNLALADSKHATKQETLAVRSDTAIRMFESLSGLCSAVAFAARTSEEKTSHQPAAGSQL